MAALKTVSIVLGTILGITILFAIVSALGNYVVVIPGFNPVSYYEGDDVPLLVDKIRSYSSRVPFAWYDIPGVCVPPDSERKKQRENIGEILMGDRLEKGPYKLQMLRGVSCEVLCTAELSSQDALRMISLIKTDYRADWYVDSLPGIYSYEYMSGKVNNETRWPLGHYFESKGVTVNNHVDLIIGYTDRENRNNRSYQVVYFEIVPRSIKNKDKTCKLGEKNEEQNRQWIEDPSLSEKGVENRFSWSYSVYWKYSSTRWVDRWTRYLSSSSGKIHWFGMINSALIALVISFMAGVIMLKTLNNDLARYNSKDPDEDESGWKLVYGDVFRPPKYPMLLSAFVGSGIQVFCTSVTLLVFAVFGFMSPENRGFLVSMSVIVFLLLSFVSGYVSTSVFKFLRGEKWRENCMLTLTLVPFTIFSIFFCMNLIFMSKHSSGYISIRFLTLLAIVWIAICTPITFLGAYISWCNPWLQNKLRITQIPRQIPLQNWYFHPLFFVLVGGIAPFACIFLEISFIISSVWMHQVYYYLFSFLFLILLILALTCSQVSIVSVYLRLCNEDYKWWWTTFFTAGGSSIYVFFYSIFYFLSSLRSYSSSYSVSIVLSIGYSLIMSLVLLLLTGSVGFLSSLFFVNKMYSSIKME